VIAFKTDGNQRYSWIKNNRSPLVSWTYTQAHRDLRQLHSMRTNRRPIAIMRRSCSDSPQTASQSDGVFGRQHPHLLEVPGERAVTRMPSDEGEDSAAYAAANQLADNTSR
jgi:hypothetical protein